MIVIKTNNITSFDVDNTLVMWHSNANEKIPGSIEFSYGDEIVYLTPHRNHIRFLKQCSIRGDYIEVWSKNGYQWAETVVKKLKLEKYVDVARSKPSRHVDDKTEVEAIAGARIYMKDD